MSILLYFVPGHLRSHPSVAVGLKGGNVKLHCWIYNIGTGDVECYDESSQTFVPMKQAYAKKSTSTDK